MEGDAVVRAFVLSSLAIEAITNQALIGPSFSDLKAGAPRRSRAIAIKGRNPELELLLRGPADEKLLIAGSRHGAADNWLGQKLPPTMGQLAKVRNGFVHHKPLLDTIVSHPCVPGAGVSRLQGYLVYQNSVFALGVVAAVTESLMGLGIFPREWAVENFDPGSIVQGLLEPKPYRDL